MPGHTENSAYGQNGPEHEKQAREIRRRIYRNMSPAEKWEQMVMLRETAWQLKRAGVRQQHPDWSDEQVEDRVREIFLYART